MVASIIYITFVNRRVVNIPFSDDWSLIALLKQDAAHQVGLSTLWAQHNENRMIIPNLIFLYVAHHAKDFEVVMMRLGAVMFCLGNLFVLLAIRSRSEINSWLRSGVNLAATIVALVGLFSLAAVENIFWAFQFAWFLIYALSALAILVIVYFARKGFPLKRTLVALVAIAVLASVSSSQGLFIFIAAIIAILIYALAESDRSRRRHHLAVAAGVAASFIIMAGIYFYNLNFTNITGPTPGRQYGIGYLYDYFTTVATTYSFGLTHHGSVIARAAVSGIYVIIVVVSLIRFIRFRTLPDPLVAYFISFAVIFELAVTMSRYQFGLLQGGSSRYALYFLPAVAVLPLLVQGWLRRPHSSKGEPSQLTIEAIDFGSVLATIARLALLGLVAFTSYKVDTNFGIPAANAIEDQRKVAVAQVQDFPKWNVPEVRLYLYPSTHFLAPYVRFFRSYESGFATSYASSASKANKL
ncbi:MAG: hypothetical protein HKL81_02835 [Acidimicrobiaceae bacterium]|nr:hypothetical protein [Acidimicrobiaceae bacterium]